MTREDEQSNVPFVTMRRIVGRLDEATTDLGVYPPRAVMVITCVPFSIDTAGGGDTDGSTGLFPTFVQITVRLMTATAKRIA